MSPRIRRTGATGMVGEAGYNTARRMVANYRGKLNIAVAQLRKEL